MSRKHHSISRPTSLQEAVQVDDGDAVLEILSSQKGLPSASLRDALLSACQFGRSNAVEAILKIESGANLLTDFGTRLLHDACVGGHPRIVNCLLKCGIDPEDKVQRGWSPCHTVAFQGELGCLQVLAQYTVNFNDTDSQGRTPSHLAAEKNHPAILNFLLQCGVDLEIPDDKGQRPVHKAARHGALECLVFFLQADCDTGVMDKLGRTPSHYAAMGDHINCLRFLVMHGANAHATDNSGKTLAHLAAHQGAMTCLHWLLDKNPENVDIQDRNGDTPTHLAGAGGHGKCFHCCIQHDADMQILNKRRECPLEAARRFGHPLVMERARTNDLQCVHCKDTFEMLEWERTHQPNAVQRMLGNAKQTTFTSPLPTVKKPKKTKTVKQRGSETEESAEGLPRRDLVAKYFVGSDGEGQDDKEDTIDNGT